MITSANVAGVPVPLGSRMPRRRPGAIRPGLVAVGRLPGRGARLRTRGGLVRVEALTPAAQLLDEGVGLRMAGLLGKAAAKGLGQAGAAVGKAAGKAIGRGAATAAKAGWNAMSPAMRHKIAVMGGKAAALKRKGHYKVKTAVRAVKRKGQQLMRTRAGAALRATGRGLKAVGRGVKASARTVHAAYQTAKAQEASAKVGKALTAARKGGDKEMVRALAMMQQGLGRGDAQRVKAAAAALKLIAKHREGGGTGVSKHAAKALGAEGQRQRQPKKPAWERELERRGQAIDREAAAGRVRNQANAEKIAAAWEKYGVKAEPAKAEPATPAPSAKAAAKTAANRRKRARKKRH